MKGFISPSIQRGTHHYAYQTIGAYPFRYPKRTRHTRRNPQRKKTTQNLTPLRHFPFPKNHGYLDYTNFIRKNGKNKKSDPFGSQLNLKVRKSGGDFPSPPTDWQVVLRKIATLLSDINSLGDPTDRLQTAVVRGVSSKTRTKVPRQTSEPGSSKRTRHTLPTNCSLPGKTSCR